MEKLDYTYSKTRVYIIAAVAATGGLLFGFDTGVISGAIPFLRQDFNLNDSQIEDFATLGLLGAVFGAAFAGRITDIVGRKKVVLVSAIIFATGALWSGLAPNVTQLMISRFYLGLAIGVSSFSVPLYIAEVSPTKIRGTLVSMFQLLITVGILASYLSNLALADDEVVSSWRAMFYVGVIPALILLIGVFFLPETPRWLMSKGREEKSRKVLRQIEEPHLVENAIVQMKEELAKDAEQADWKVIFQPWLRTAFIIGVGIMFFQQFVGINTVIYYAPDIFLKAGFEGAEAALFATVSVGVVNVLFTILSLYLIDRIGRRKLYFIGMWGIVVSLIAMGASFAIESEFTQYFLVASVLIYIAFFAISLGPLGWLIISEIFPLKVRGVSTSIGALSNWGFNTLVAFTFYKLSNILGQAEVFWLYAAIGIIGLIWGKYFIPETKGVTLEKIEEHWRQGRKPTEL